MMDETGRSKCADLSMEDSDNGDLSSYNGVDSEPVELLHKLPPVTDPSNIIKIALRVPSGERSVIDLEPSLRLKVHSSCSKVL